ncbi:MAG: GHKL domain-containing protein [Clostridia bacterium]|nr:GHKL domain-containing protein [Clostridia bacterium]
MNYTFIYEFFSLTVFALAAAGIMTFSFVEKKYSKLRCFILFAIPKIIQQFAQYYEVNVEKTPLTTVLFCIATALFDFVVFFVVFDGTLQEIIVTIFVCEIAALPMVLYKSAVQKIFAGEGQTRLCINDLKSFLMLVLGFAVVVALSLAVMHLIGKLLKKVNYNTKIFNVLGKIGFCLYFIIDALAIIGSVSDVLDFRMGSYLGHYFFWGGIWVAIFVAMYMINDYFTKKRLRREIEILNEEKARQFEYFRLVKNHNDEIRKIRHDMRGHLSVISGFINEDEYERAEEYISAINDAFSKIKRVSFTGNITADTVISEMAEKCRKENIKFKHNGLLPEKIMVDDVSLTCVLVNVFDNAIEACLRMDKSAERFINSDICISCGCVVLRCENSKNPSETVDEKNPETSKKESGHGYGRRILKDIVNEYSGTIEWKDKGYSFEVKILLTEK